MSKGTRTCKVCGAEYEYCKTNRPTGTFRWQDVACSPEHGSIYFARIAESRAKKADAKKIDPVNVIQDKSSVVEENPVDNEPEVIEGTITLVDETAAIPEEVTTPDQDVSLSPIIDFTTLELDETYDWESDSDEWVDDDEDDWLDDDDDDSDAWTRIINPD